MVERLTLTIANHMVAAALAEARRAKSRPLAIVVVDAGGHLVVVQREDGAASLRARVALGKASGSLAMLQSSRSLANIAADRPTFFASLAFLAPDGLIPSPGGHVIVNADRVVIGAIGASGDHPDVDEACALAGLKAVKFDALD